MLPSGQCNINSHYSVSDVETLNLSQSIKCEIKYEHLSRLETNHYPLVGVWDIPPPLPPSVRNNIPYNEARGGDLWLLCYVSVIHDNREIKFKL